MFINNSEKYKKDRHMLGEQRDCTVVALCEFTGNSYKSCILFLDKYAKRKPCRGLTKEAILKAFEKGFKKIKYQVKEFDKKITLGRFCKEYSTGEYYVAVTGHCLFVKDGVIYDHSHSPRRMVKWCVKKIN